LSRVAGGHIIGDWSDRDEQGNEIRYSHLSLEVGQQR
jgi:hypothetical protein